MNKETNPRMQWALKPGDQLICSGKIYTVTGDPLGFGGSACVYPAGCGDCRTLAIKECMPSTIPLARQGVLLAQRQEDAPLLEQYRQRQTAEIAISQQIASLTRRAIGVWDRVQPEKLVVNGTVWENSEGVSFGLMERLDQMGLSFADMRTALAPRKQRMPITMTLRMIRETVKALGRIHAAGYLHCDIQPHNIYFTDYQLASHSVGDAYLLDFGCARKLDGEYAHIGEDADIFTTHGYTPPELLAHPGGNIRLSKAADLYSVGALLLRCVLSESMIRVGNTHVGHIDAERIGCGGDARDALNEILDRLLAPEPENRYASCEELRTELDRLLDMVTPPTHLLPGLPDAGTFIGRGPETDAVVRAVKGSRQPFIFGIGGYGKSELAVQAARMAASAKGAYFVPYLGSMRQTILSMFPQRRHFRETERESYENNLALLAREYRDAVLVIDNFWSMDRTMSQLQSEPAFADLMRLCPGIKLIFTTRYRVPGGIEIGPLDQPDLLSLMRFHLQGTQVEEADLLSLIRKTHGHTLLLILIAKLLHESVLRVTPAMVLEALERGQLHQFHDYELPADRMGVNGREYTERQLHAHLSELFRLYALNDAQKLILRCAAMIPASGMDLRLFQDALGQEKPVLELVKIGLLQRHGDTVRIHDLIRAAVREDLKPQPEHCAAFLDALWGRFNDRVFRSEYTQIAGCLSVAANTLAPCTAFHDRAAAVCSFLGSYEQALTLYRAKLGLLQQEPGVSSVTLAQVLNHIGTTCGMLGQARQQRDALVTAACLLGGELCGTNPGDPLPLNWDDIVDARDMPELARTYLELAHSDRPDKSGGFKKFLEEARGYTEMAMDILRDLGSSAPADLHWDAFLTLASIAAVEEDWEDAAYYAEKAQHILRSTPNPHPIKQIEMYTTMANIQHHREEYRQEAETRETALDLAKRFYPVKHPVLGPLRHELACAYWCCGDYGKAIDEMRGAVEMERQTLPPQHPSLADSLASLSDFYQMEGQPEDALRTLHEAAEASSMKSMEELGLHYLDADAETGFRWLLRSADAGSATAAYHAGACLLHGVGCQKDPQRAEEYLHKGIGAPYPAGAYSLRTLAGLYLGMENDAPDHPIDLITAARYLREAEMRGLPVDDYLHLLWQIIEKRRRSKN